MYWQTVQKENINKWSLNCETGRCDFSHVWYEKYSAFFKSAYKHYWIKYFPKPEGVQKREEPKHEKQNKQTLLVSSLVGSQL